MTKDANAFQVIANLESGDFRKARLFDAFWRKKWYTIYLSVFFLFSLAVIICKAAGIFDVPTILFSCAIFMLAIVVLLVLYLSFSGEKDTKTRKYTFTPNAILTPAGHDNKTMSLSYGNLIDIYETKSALYIYMDETQFLILPKRCITEEQLKTIKGFYTAKVQGKNHLK